jgi:hypothetical protein
VPSPTPGGLQSWTAKRQHQRCFLCDESARLESITSYDAEYSLGSGRGSRVMSATTTKRQSKRHPPLRGPPPLLLPPLPSPFPCCVLNAPPLLFFFFNVLFVSIARCAWCAARSVEATSSTSLSASSLPFTCASTGCVRAKEQPNVEFAVCH